MSWWYHWAVWHDQQALEAIMGVLVFIVMWLVGLTMYVVRRKDDVVGESGRGWSLLLFPEAEEALVPSDENEGDDLLIGDGSGG